MYSNVSFGNKQMQKSEGITVFKIQSWRYAQAA